MRNLSFSYYVQAASAVIMAMLILKFIVFSEVGHWQKKFQDLSVPAFSYPGGDARNIQLTSFCQSTTQSQEEFDQCYRDASPVLSVHKQADVPPYNYPEIWVDIYSFFDNYSEEFFMAFWQTNASLFFLVLLLVSLRTAPVLFPVAAFSPAALLTIERGNIDAVTFAILYTPFVLGLRSQLLGAFFVGLAATAKIFPIFAAPVFFMKPFRSKWKSSSVGLLLSLPLVVASFLSLFRISENTSSGFLAAYGFMSLSNAPIFKDGWLLTASALAFFVVATAAWVVVSARKKTYRPLLDELSGLKASDLYLLYTSVLIFGVTFLVFVNWSYRLIFLFPALFILSRLSSLMAKILFANIITILWIPFFPSGWGLQNLLCYSLFLFLLPLYIFGVREIVSSTVENLRRGGVEHSSRPEQLPSA